MNAGDHALLLTALAVSVPLWIDRVRTYDESTRANRSNQCVQMICEHGDDIMFKSKKRGESATAFNALAEAIAILSFAPGGVTFHGLHFESSR